MRKEEVDKAHKIEHTHWWYAGTREICFDLLDRYVFSPRNDRSCSILDIGCGTGGNLEFFKKYGQAEGIDCDQHAIAYCLTKGLAAATVSMTQLSGYPKRFDLISFFDVLNQIPFSDQKPVMAQVSSLLNENGHVILREPALDFFSGRHDREVGIQKRYDRGVMRDLLESAGLTVVYLSYINMLLAPLIYCARKCGLLLDKTPRSDVVETGPLLNALLLAVLRLEKKLLRGITFPFGVSLVAIARKPKKGSL
jgi:SAM-dependent methyltransferase